VTCHHILAVLGTDDHEADVVLREAVELAEREHATLTLAALTGETWLMRWLAALALSAAACAPTLGDLATFAERRVARAAEFIPTGVSVTTTVVADARRLVASGRYDLVVIGARQAARHRLKHLTIPALVVPKTGGHHRYRTATAPSPAMTG
jgi:hypothetical protein